MCTIFFVISDRRTINLEINKTGLSCIIYINFNGKTRINYLFSQGIISIKVLGIYEHAFGYLFYNKLY